MINTITMIDAIRSLTPTAEWTSSGFDYPDLTWLSNTITKPTEIELSNEVSRLEQLYIINEYQRLRKAKYDLLNQDEMRFDDLINGTTTWQDAIIAIKLMYPKTGV